MFEKDLGKDRVIKRKGRTISHGMCAIEGNIQKSRQLPEDVKAASDSLIMCRKWLSANIPHGSPCLKCLWFSSVYA